MGKEIERKFLLDHAKWHQIEKPPGTHYRQGYLFKDTTKTIRVRLSSAECTLTIKGPITGISRDEYEYEIPAQDALEMIENLASTEITKIRYKIHFEGKTWEVDEFLGENSGLFIAEIELEREDEVFSLPAWVTEEVTGQKKYYNYNLSVEPFKQWP